MSHQCPSCKDIYNWTEKIPKCLPCGHSICKSCASKCPSKKRVKKVLCCICKVTSQVDINKLRDDDEILAEMDLAFARQLEEDDKKECSVPLWDYSVVGKKNSTKSRRSFSQEPKLEYSSVVKRSISSEPSEETNQSFSSVVEHQSRSRKSSSTSGVVTVSTRSDSHQNGFSESNTGAAALVPDITTQVRDSLEKSIVTLNLSDVAEKLSSVGIPECPKSLEINLSSSLKSDNRVEKATASHIINLIMTVLFPDSDSEKLKTESSNPQARESASSLARLFSNNDAGEPFINDVSYSSERIPLGASLTGKENHLLDEAIEKGKEIYFVEFAFKGISKRVLIALEKDEAPEMCKRFRKLCNSPHGYKYSTNIKCCPRTFVICESSKRIGAPKLNALFVPSLLSNIPPVCGTVVMDSTSRDKKSGKWQVGSAFRIRLCKNEMFYGRAFGSVVSGIQVAFDMAALGTDVHPYNTKDAITIVDCGPWQKKDCYDTAQQEVKVLFTSGKQPIAAKFVQDF